MNYIQHLNVFFSIVQKDKTLSTAHISLYMAMFQYWNAYRFQNPFPVSRDNMMQLSKIGSKNTYHKCIKELHHTRFIVCHPRNSKFEPLKISIPRLDLKWEQIGSIQLDIFNDSTISQCPKNEPMSVPELIPQSVKIGLATVPKLGLSYKPNNKLLKCVQNTPKKNKPKNDFLKTKKSKKNLGSPAPKKVPAPKKESPQLSEIIAFFQANNFPEEEAHKFFYYNEGKDWMLTPKIKIKKWQPLVHKWMLSKNEILKTNNHHVSTVKKYATPL